MPGGLIHQLLQVLCFHCHQYFSPMLSFGNPLVEADALEGHCGCRLCQHMRIVSITLLDAVQLHADWRDVARLILPWGDGYDADNKTSLNLSQCAIGQSMHIGASATRPQNQALHFSHLTQPSNPTTTPNNVLDTDPHGYCLPHLYEIPLSHTPDIPSTGAPPPQDTSIPRPRVSTPEIHVPIVIQYGLRPNDDNAIQRSILAWSHSQAEQEHNAMYTLYTHDQQTGRTAPFTSQIERF